MQSWMLPPRSPALMPLDFCLWSEIEERTLKNTGVDQETRSQYAARLRRTALRLPKDIVKNCLAKMKENILEVVKAKGKNTVLD